jgi:hypothetical protein
MIQQKPLDAMNGYEWLGNGNPFRPKSASLSGRYYRKDHILLAPGFRATSVQTVTRLHAIGYENQQSALMTTQNQFKSCSGILARRLTVALMARTKSL